MYIYHIRYNGKKCVSKCNETQQQEERNDEKKMPL